jgi:hypothetical protein
MTAQDGTVPAARVYCGSCGQSSPPPLRASCPHCGVGAHAPATVQRATAPSVGIMWVNALLFWGFFPGIYLIYLTFRNIGWARRHGKPWLRYAMPIATLLLLFVAVLIFASTLPDPANNPYGSSP